MRGLLLALALALAPLPAAATQEYVLPTLFDVTGVAPGDALNVRAGPGTGHAVIGTLAHDAERIEVVAHDATGRWGRVNIGEGAGWAAMRHLAYRTDVWEWGVLPADLRCFGTEPFWSFRLEGDGIAIATPDAPEAAPLPLVAVLDRGIFRDPLRALLAAGGRERLTASIVPHSCSDGMSDRAYGLAVSAIREGAEPPVLLTGCCSIAP